MRLNIKVLLHEVHLRYINMCSYPLVLALIVISIITPTPIYAISSSNIPLDSPVYAYLDKLAGFGLIYSDIKGIKPFSKAEAARLLKEAENNIGSLESSDTRLATELVACIRTLIPREVSLREKPDSSRPFFDYNPISSLRLRYLWLAGVPRDYRRDVHDPGDDGVFGMSAGLRPINSPSATVRQRGGEGTPLVENNNGTVYGNGHNGELRLGSELYLGEQAVGLLEESLQTNGDELRLRINRGYLKIGGGSVELEAGKDENWFGLGYRGAITLTNNAENFTQLKLSSPEPIDAKLIGALKYSLIFSSFEKTNVDGIERHPWFYAIKFSSKPTPDLEVGINIGRQVGGPGVDNNLEETLRGLIGGTNDDNSNGIAGIEARYRFRGLRNTEVYAEFSGEDNALFWPIVESYLAGLYIPLLTDDGRNDFRFEFFLGNQILYTHTLFPNGYILKNMPIGHSQGGATQDFFFRYSHWFSVRNNLALEYFYTNRGMVGRVQGQSVERKHSGRIFWSLPLYGDLDGQIGYGIEKVSNLNLVYGQEQTNQMLKFELRYLY